MRLLKRTRWLVLMLLPWLVAMAQGPARLTQIVGQATPTVTWAAPPSIGYGTPLDGTQLDAKASVPGTFVYAPATGALLSSGQQTLTAVFTPADVNYKSVNVQVPLTVRPVVGATFDLGAWHPPNGQIVWTPGDTITVWLTPVGDFHQPIQLSCAVTGGFSCKLDHDVMRPENVPLPLQVTISWLGDQGTTPVRVPGGPVPALLVLAIMLGRKKRLRGVVVLMMIVGMVGCGSERTGVATITGRSLTEVKTLVIHVVDRR